MYYNVKNPGSVTAGSCRYPLTVYKNGKGCAKRTYSGGILEQGQCIFLNQKEVLHRKFECDVYPLPKANNMSIVSTLIGDALVNKLGYGRGLTDMRQLNCALAVPNESGSYTHFVVTPFQEGYAHYMATYAKNYGWIQPTWTIYWIAQDGDRLKVRSCTPSGQGWNKPSGFYTTAVGYPQFTEAQLQEIGNSYAAFLEQPYNQSFYDENMGSLSTYEPDFTPGWRVDDSKIYLGDLSASAIKGVEFFTGNGQALIRDVMHINDAFTSSIKDIQGMSKGKAKAFASAYLSVHYGYKLLAADINELAAELNRYIKMYANTSVSASNAYSENGIKFTDGLHIYYELFGKLPSDLSKLAYLLDLTPSWHGIWDSIPFSFVLDWVGNIGDLCSGIDDFYTLSQRHDVLGSTVSHKKERSFTRIIEHEQYMVKQSTYVRRCTKGWMPIPTLQFNVGVPSLGHAGEATALIVSKTK